jgi:16S rRNA (uracil1498-N3)-methyltransferase
MSVTVPTAMHQSNPDHLPRLFVADDLVIGTPISLPAAQTHYLTRVMRRGMGDAVRLFNGRDGEMLGRLTGVTRNAALCLPDTQLRAQDPEPDLWLAFAPLKREATELVVEKATELGVSRLIPVLTDRCNSPRMNAERWRAIATEAAEQSERLSLPSVAEPVRLPALLASWPAERPLIAAVERSGASLITAPPGPAGLLIGPEGGFAPDELEFMRRHPFVIAASLGPRILRAETAAIVGLALLQARNGG